MSSFVAVFRRFIFGALDLIRSTNAHSVKLLTAETIWLVDQIQYVHTPPIKSNISTHRSSPSAASSAGQICLFYHQRDSWERNGEIWEQICFFWCRGEPVIVEQIQARTTFAADGFRIWDLKLVRHKHCLKDLRLCTNTTQWRFKRHHYKVLFLSHFLLTHRLSDKLIASENKVSIKISQAISFLPLQHSVPIWFGFDFTIVKEHQIYFM